MQKSVFQAYLGINCVEISCSLHTALVIVLITIIMNCASLQSLSKVMYS